MGAGFGLSKAFSVDEHTLTRILTDFFMPALVFYSLYASDVMFGETLRLLGATSAAVIFLILLAYGYCRISGASSRAFAPSICFMNSGFLGIPLMALWGGVAAVNIEVIIDQMQTFYIFTLGILIVSGGFKASGLKEMVKTPLLWAIFAGFFFKFTGIRIPESIMAIFEFSGTGASSLAAFTVGCSMSSRKLVFNRHLLAGLVLRFGGGFLAGLAAAEIFGLTGLSRTVLIVATSLPSAVFSYVLPLRYGVDTELAGSMVVISTLLGIVMIPLFFMLASIV
jgi:predicted permease